MNDISKTNRVEKNFESLIHSANAKIERWSSPPTSFQSDISLVGGIRLSKWRRQVGLSRTTIWRWRKSGRLPVVMRYGVPFLAAETVKSFFRPDAECQ
jgi:hypothetical protein